MLLPGLGWSGKLKLENAVDKKVGNRAFKTIVTKVKETKVKSA